MSEADARIERLAGAQNGVVTLRQLYRAGLTSAAIRARVRRGALFHVARGIYCVAHPSLLPLARQTAALLSLAPAVLSHRSAAALWGLVGLDSQSVDVTLIGHKARPRAGIVLHRTALLHVADIRTRCNLRVTAPARSFIDLASEAPRHEFDEAIGEARAKGLVTDRSLDEALARAPRNHPGASILRSMLCADPGRTYTRSAAERKIRKLLREAGLPQPAVNVLVHGELTDFFWPDHKLILEVDGYATHGNRAAFERDRRRDQVHVAAGYVVVRVTWWQLCNEPLGVIARIAQALALRAHAA